MTCLYCIVGQLAGRDTLLAGAGRRFCENCGTELSQTTNFCPNCGAAQHAEPETPPPSQPPTPQQPQRHTMRNVITVLVLLIVLIILIRACGGGQSSSSSKSGATTASQTSTSKQAQKSSTSNQQASQSSADPNPHFSDGTQRVGQDIQPGTYRTRKGSSGCYYARLSGFSNDLNNILANDNTDGPAVVTILPTDAGFQSKRCGTWTQDLSAITTDTTSFTDGTYIVGTDIEPGTYRNSGASGCYYVRLSGFTGDFSNIIANENTDAPAVVTIAPTDAGFQAKRCGTWTKIG